MTDEQPLAGGLTGAVRVGDTIRRPLAPWSARVHELLRHLEQVGFAGSPRLLGVDGQGREILSLLPGNPAWPPGPGLGSLHTLESAARLVRAYHDAVTGWTAPADGWQTMPAAPLAAEVICHNDLAPWNMLTIDGQVTGLVDWDAASPGPRSWDLAYLTYTFVPLYQPGHLDLIGWPQPIDVPERLRVIRDSYGCDAKLWNDTLTSIATRVQVAYETMRTYAAEDRPGWRAQWEQPEPWRHGQGLLRDVNYINAQLTQWFDQTRAPTNR